MIKTVLRLHRKPPSHRSHILFLITSWSHGRRPVPVPPRLEWPSRPATVSLPAVPPLGPYIYACTRTPSHHPNTAFSSSSNLDEEAAASCRPAPTWGLCRFPSKPQFFWLRSWPSASAPWLGRRQRRQRRRRRSWLAASSAWTAPPTMSMPSKVHANRQPAHLHYWFNSVATIQILPDSLELATAFLSKKLYVVLAAN